MSNSNMSNQTVKFTEVMSTNPPRLVVQFQCQPSTGDEKFKWGVQGHVPILSMLGAIVHVQAELPLLEPDDPHYDCPERALVITWDATARRCLFFVHPDVPVEAMVGMLDTIKLTIQIGRTGQQAASQSTRVLGPDGSPMRG